MLNFLMLGAVFVAGTFVAMQAYQNFIAGSLTNAIGFGIAALATVILAKRLYDGRRRSSVDEAIAEAEFEMFSEDYL